MLANIAYAKKAATQKKISAKKDLSKSAKKESVQKSSILKKRTYNDFSQISASRKEVETRVTRKNAVESGVFSRQPVIQQEFMELESRRI